MDLGGFDDNSRGGCYGVKGCGRGFRNKLPTQPWRSTAKAGNIKRINLRINGEGYPNFSVTIAHFKAQLPYEGVWMTGTTIRLDLLPDAYAVARLDPGADVPEWASSGDLISITKTQDELSILCRESLQPPDVQAQRGFRCFRVAGPLAFTEVGVLDSLAHPLAEADVSIFVLSTYDTDYLFLPEDDLELGIKVLSDAGHSIRRLDSGS